MRFSGNALHFGIQERGRRRNEPRLRSQCGKSRIRCVAIICRTLNSSPLGNGFQALPVTEPGQSLARDRSRLCGFTQWRPGIGRSPTSFRFGEVFPVSQIVLPSFLFVPPVHNRVRRLCCLLLSFSLGRVRAHPRARTVASDLRRYRAKREAKAVWHVPRCHSQPDTLRGFRLGSATSGCFCRGGHGEQQKQPETAEGDNHHEAGRNQPENKRGSRVSR